EIGEVSVTPRRWLLGLTVISLSASPAPAADPWHRPEWQGRAVIEIPKPSTETGVDTAAVRVLCQGRAQPDGSDYLVLDVAGSPVLFQLMSHDAALYSLIAFRAVNPRQRYFIYFGNPKAKRVLEQIDAKLVSGTGPPQGAWIPRYALVLETMQRPEG